MSESFFSQIELAPPIEVFSLTARYKADNFPEKVDLGVGAYRNDEGNPWVLPVVRSVETQMAADPNLNKEYLPVIGLKSFTEAAVQLLLGAESPPLVNGLASSVQALGGTGALYLAIMFASKHLNLRNIYVSKPTWGNHKTISKLAGFTTIGEYRYWDASSRTVDFKGMLEDIESFPDKSVIILHACAHNPTGMDLSKDQWAELLKLIQKKKHLPIMDIAYQGFASGDLENDAYAVRLFANSGLEMFIAQSFSKNFGLYNERVGNCIVITKSSQFTQHVISQMALLVRYTWSNPSSHGCRVVASVLNNSALFQEWKGNVKVMADRIIQMRQKLYETLRQLGTPGNWEHIIKQIGMFSYTGLTRRQAETMIKDYHVYMMLDGRISMCGLNQGNVDYVARAIDYVVRNVADDPKL